MVPARVRPPRKKREDRSEKRAETDKHEMEKGRGKGAERVESRNGSVPGMAGRGGKGSAPNRKEAERGMVPARVRPLRGKREERMGQRAGRRAPHAECIHSSMSRGMQLF